MLALSSHYLNATVTGGAN